MTKYISNELYKGWNKNIAKEHNNNGGTPQDKDMTNQINIWLVRNASRHNQELAMTAKSTIGRQTLSNKD